MYKKALSTALATLLAIAITPGVAHAGPADYPGDPVNKPLTPVLKMLSKPAQRWGANDVECKPSPRHPRPVVLVHGTWTGSFFTWKNLTKLLVDEGYCVFVMDYGQDKHSLVGALPGVYGTGDMWHSMREVAQFNDWVLEVTGADQIDTVGHSQGNIMNRGYIQYFGGWNPEDPRKNKVHTTINLGPNQSGATLMGLAAYGNSGEDLWGMPITESMTPYIGASGMQQAIGAPFYQEFNKYGYTRPGVHYVAIITTHDEINMPYRSQFYPHERGSWVTNLVVQDRCPQDLTEHTQMPNSLHVQWLVMSMLDSSYAETHPMQCAALPVL